MDVKKFRFDYHLGQKEFAAVIGCTQANVSRIEMGLRSLTGAQVGALIDKYGLDVIARYADPSELPAQSTINIDMHKTQITGNNGPVQNGDNNNINADDELREMLKKQSSQIDELLKQNRALIEQQNRLLDLLEKQK